MNDAYSLSQRIGQFKREWGDLVKSLQEYLKNTSIPLEDRWSIFYSAMDILPNYSSLLHFKAIQRHGHRWPNITYKDRYETIYLADVVDHIEDEQNPDGYGSPRLSEIDLDELKEEILQLGYASFTMDW
jgi:hypothetical protein